MYTTKMDNKAVTAIQGKVFIVDNELNLITPDKTFTKAEMQIHSDEYKGMNRLHKPMALLFWSDVKNGKAANWQLSKEAREFHNIS